MRCVLASLPERNEGSALLGLMYLKEYAMRDPQIPESVEINIVEFNKGYQIDDVVWKVCRTNPDVVGFSCYVWNIEDTLKACRIIKKLMPEVRIMLGGPEVSYRAETYMREIPEIDIIVRGEGEETFRELIKHFVSGNPKLQRIKGISFRREGRIFHNADRPPIRKLDLIPSPYPFIEDGVSAVVIETSRGCPFRCRYCVWGGMCHNVRYFSVERVRTELQKAFEANAKKVVIYDSVFNINNTRMRKLAASVEQIVNEQTNLVIEAKAEFVSKEQIKLFRKMNVTFVETGLQAVNPETLKNIGRNLNHERFSRGLKLLNDYGINNDVDVILGLPGDNFFTFRKSLEFVLRHKGSNALVHYFVNLPGTWLYENSRRFGIVSMDHAPYRVLSTSSFGMDEIKKAQLMVKSMMAENPSVRVFNKNEFFVHY